jgi:thiol-disulfide isomerase/thioredoxin
MAVLYCACFGAGIWAVSDNAMAGEGAPAPNCSLRLIEGGPSTSINQLRGKVLYVDFWASWCIPCRASFPFMNALDKDLKGKGLKVVAINVDEKPEDAKRFLTKYPARFAIAVKANEACAKQFGVEGMPSSFVVDRRGVIRHVHQGFRPEDAGRLHTLINQLLSEKGN